MILHKNNHKKKIKNYIYYSYNKQKNKFIVELIIYIKYINLYLKMKNNNSYL